MTRMYSAEPAPDRAIAARVDEAERPHPGDDEQRENSQYEKTLSRESSRIDTSALPRPNQAIWVPNTTSASTPRSLIHSRREYVDLQSVVTAAARPRSVERAGSLAAASTFDAIVSPPCPQREHTPEETAPSRITPPRR